MTLEDNRLRIKEMVESFRDAGIESHDNLIVHSSYRSIGGMEKGPAGVIEALLEATAGGNIMFPAFNYSRPLPDPWYDPRFTPCRTGVIPETARRMKGAVRSLNPTHSVSVIGPDADEFTRGHLETETFGINSPIDKLARTGGKVVLIGVGHTADSMVHIAEAYAGIPKFSWHALPLPVVKIRTPKGTIIKHRLDSSPSCSAAFNSVEFPLRSQGLIRETKAGKARVQVVSGEDVIECSLTLMASRADILLCAWPGCKPCAGSREILKREGRFSWQRNSCHPPGGLTP